MKPGRIAAWIFLAVGLILLTIAGVVFRNEQRFVAVSLPAEGVVRELLLDRSTSRTGTGSSRRVRTSNVYKPLVAFETAEGESVEFLSSSGSNPPAYSAGDRVEVRYRPDFPERAKLAGFWGLYLGSFILGILAVAFTLIGVIVFFTLGRA